MLLILLGLLLVNIAFCQPWLAEQDLDRLLQKRPVLGLFKNETQASVWLGVGGLASMVTGSYLSGRAAHHIQYHGSTGGNLDTYHTTRFAGLSLQLGGTAAYSIAFAYRSKRWYRKNPVLFGLLEAGVLFGANAAISQWSYHQMNR